MAEPEDISAVLKRYWGFDTLRPLQSEAIRATLAGRDLVTVLPTGGGKSLCYQVPPLVSGTCTLVVSPLIALMRDQLSGLKVAGVPAAAAHSHASAREASELREMARDGSLRLLLVSPERLLMPDFLAFCVKIGLGAIAIDEAHCISQWGHDFRPEYRRLRELREVFPGVPIAAYTATATPRVREDIAAQLELRRPVELVGVFDRPNLTYRVLPRVSVHRQVAEVLQRHADRAAIVYCISRKDTELMAAALRSQGIDARAYHAGLTADERTDVSDAFKSERLNVVCATVAFGMGIDRGDVRCVVHAAMPKSIEHYQQETGRAGRDGLPAECVLFHSSSDVMKWRDLMGRAAEESGGAEFFQAQVELLNQMHRLISSARCRHRALTEYFGQEYAGNACNACDFCLGELEEIHDAHDTARKIISCVARCGQRFGAQHIADVLLGSRSERVLKYGHEALSTHGLLSSLAKDQVVSYINQLVDAGHLTRSEGEYPVVTLTPTSQAVLKSEVRATLVEPKAPVPGRRVRGGVGGGSGSGWGGQPTPTGRGAGGGGQDQAALSTAESKLFDELRTWRRTLSQSRGVPPYVILGDDTLEELCRVRPSTPMMLRTVKGIGEVKAADFGGELLAEIAKASDLLELKLDAVLGSRAPKRGTTADVPSTSSLAAAELFRSGKTIEQVMDEMGRARSTVTGYLLEFLTREKPASIEPWVDAATHQRVSEALRVKGSSMLKPVFEAFGGEISYETIRLVATHERVAPREMVK